MKTTRLRVPVLLSAFLLWAGVLSLGLPRAGRAAPEKGAAPEGDAHAEQVKRGEFLVAIGGCNDCHTPWRLDRELGMPMPDMSRMLSGHPEGAPDPASAYTAPDMGIIGPTFTSFRMPFGVVYAPNLTPDLETGIGSWSEADFVRALKTGKHMGGTGRPILAPMPWPGLSRLPEADLKAIYAYLHSIPAVANRVPPAKVPDHVLAQISESNDKLVMLMRRPPAAAAETPAEAPTTQAAPAKKQPHPPRGK